MINGKVTGCSFFNIRLEEWKKLEIGTIIELKRDTSNPYDKFAIQAVYNGKQIGWVGRPENKYVSERLDQESDVTVEITRVFGNPMDRPHIELQFAW